jgi:uncharacterized protein (TIGR03083 family)
MEIFDEIAAERLLTADFLATLDAEQLATESLCEGWTVHDVGAHLLMPLITPMPKVILAMVGHGFNWDGANKSLTRGVAALSTADIATGLRTHADGRFTPPGAGPEAPLTDLLIHGQDMRRPLGITREIPPQRLRVALDYLTSGTARGVVPADRLTDLSFAADDLDWAAGEGPAVTGAGEALLLAIAGRPAALADLSGAGSEEFAARILPNER